ncbi:MAG TPA: hypothetical protein VMU84_00940 [Thermoanaerobaculia bacterium]|nr:hypothetical protein [Thermoanaerobaculia bacterium]
MAFKQVSGWRAVVLAVSALLGIATALAGYADMAKTWLPPALSRYVPLVMIFGFACALWAIGTSAEKVDGVLYRENVKLRNRLDELEKKLQRRSLNASQHGAIVVAVEQGIRALQHPLPDSKDKRPHVGFIAIGTERETLDYRYDFVKAFDEGGLGVWREDWEPVEELDAFRGAVTVLISSNDASNQIRPIVVAALQAAGISFKEAPHPNVRRLDVAISRSALDQMFLSSRTAAYLLVGSRV